MTNTAKRVISYARSHKRRAFAVAAAAVAIAAVFGVSRAASAAPAAPAAVTRAAAVPLPPGAPPGTVFHTMRPAGNTAYCVADLAGNGQNLSLINPCNRGSVESWGVEPTSYSPYYVQIQNLVTGLCMSAHNYSGGVLYGYTCNGSIGEAWLELPNSNGTVGWESGQPGSAGLCADASATLGVRGYTCNGTIAQDWWGPQ